MNGCLIYFNKHWLLHNLRMVLIDQSLYQPISKEEGTWITESIDKTRKDSSSCVFI